MCEANSKAFYFLIRYAERDWRAQVIGGQIETAQRAHAKDLDKMSTAEKIKNFFKKKKTEAKFKVSHSWAP